MIGWWIAVAESGGRLYWSYNAEKRTLPHPPLESDLIYTAYLSMYTRCTRKKVVPKVARTGTKTLQAESKADPPQGSPQLSLTSRSIWVRLTSQLTSLCSALSAITRLTRDLSLYASTICQHSPSAIYPACL